VTALLIARLLTSFLWQTGNIETSDGFYCRTARYFAYETLLHDSSAPHLLHIVSLDDPAGARPELTTRIGPQPVRGVRCVRDIVAIRGEATTTYVRIDLHTWRAEVPEQPGEIHPGSERWQSTRLWGTGAWADSASQRVVLRRFEAGGRVNLEIVRVSNGGPHCTSNAGARIVWYDRSGREIHARAIFLRHADCARAGLTPPPSVDDCAPQPGRVLRTFHGRVNADESYSHASPPFRIELKPEGSFGWTIGVRPIGEDRQLVSMIPLHGRSGRDIQPQDVTAQHWLERQFQFHPAMRRTIVYSDDAQTMLVDDLRVRAYGRGRLTIERYALGKDEKGQPRFEWIEFSGCLTWPR
jgi:hypothetical protein